MPTIQELDAKYGISGQQSASAQMRNPLSQGPPSTEGVSNITGTLGSLGLGGLAGLLTEGNPYAIKAGEVSGGAIGGPLPQIAGDIGSRQNPLTDPVVRRQAMEQGLYGLLPGSQAGKPEERTLIGGLKKAARAIPKRAATGAAVGAGESTIGQLSQPGGQLNLPQTLSQAGITGGLNALIPGGADILAQPSKGVTAKTVAAIEHRTQTAPGLAEQLGYRNAADNLVGHYNTDYATNEGILPKSHIDATGKAHPKVTFDTQAINDAMEKRTTKAVQVRRDLMNALPDRVQVPATDIEGIIKKDLATAYGLKPTDTKTINRAYTNFLATVQKNAEANVKEYTASRGFSHQEGGVDIPQTSIGKPDFRTRAGKGPIVNTQQNVGGKPSVTMDPNALNNFLSGKAPGNLKLTNALKEAIGEKWDNKNNNSEYNRIYMDLKNYIEQKSGNPEAVAALNQEAHQLADINSNLKDAKMAKVPPQGTTAEDIAVQKEIARNKKPSSATLNMISNVAGLGAGMGGYALLNALTNLGIVQSGAGGWLIGMGARHAAEQLLNNPDVQEQVAKFIEAKGTKTVTTEVGKALQQLGVKSAVSQALSQ